MKNIILIGMPGCGKSTVGVILAKAANMSFLDTDLLIQTREGALLQTLIDRSGIEAFLAIEEAALCAVSVQNTVISTGGSAVYSAAAMKHLKQSGTVVFLDVPMAELLRRIDNMHARGIVIEGSFAETYEARRPLYQQYADRTIDCAGRSIEQVVDAFFTREGRLILT